MNHNKFIKRCLELAELGRGHVSPNPMVGAVIVVNDQIIGEGFHQKYGEPHAEVNAINSVVDTSLLQQATIYVSLEPCSHHGKTPPCADLIIKSKIPKVVIATIDPHAKVCGNGIRKLKEAGIEVITGVLENESNLLNRSFNTFHQKKRPFIILKWAETKDGFIDHIRFDNGTPALQISNKLSSIWVHKLRSETDAILVGTTTARLDDPSLTTRKWAGKNPLRLVIDKELKLSKDLQLFDGSQSTLVYNNQVSELILPNVERVFINPDKDFIEGILQELHSRNVASVLIEGGAHTIQRFIDQGSWDVAYKITSNNSINSGVSAPKIKNLTPIYHHLGDNQIHQYDNNN